MYIMQARLSPVSGHFAPLIRHHLRDDFRAATVIKKRSLLRGGAFNFGSILGSIGKFASKILPTIAPVLVNAGLNKVQQLADSNPNTKVGQALGKVSGLAKSLAPTAGVLSSALAQGLSGSHPELANTLGQTSQNVLQEIMKRGKGMKKGQGIKGIGVRGIGNQQNVIPTRLA